MQRNKKIRLIVDANIWISSMLTLPFRARTEVFFNSENLLLVSEELFDELDDAILKPYPAKKIVREEYDKLVARLRNVAELVDVHSVVEICRDPKDNFLLALAKDGDADYLITGDKDLLVLKEFEKTKIIDMNEFETR
jgi:putative PIN family toxin of toxin-antitoxin system